MNDEQPIPLDKTGLDAELALRAIEAGPDTTSEQYTTLEDAIIARLNQLHDAVNKEVLKQRLFGQIDALDWVMQQIDQLRDDDEPIPLVPTESNEDRFQRQRLSERSPWAQEFPPQHTHQISQPSQDILDGLWKAGENYHRVTSNDGAKIYIRENGQWVQSPGVTTGGVMHGPGMNPEALRRLKEQWEAVHKITDITES